ncbi:MAG: hypothetical protein KGI75_23705 [Rhizobiaceae bacterium]|nr:hypothetical protein [Rhizobiaceae bacterium]
MMDGIALAKAIELQNQARYARYKSDEEAFYQQHCREPAALLIWFGRIADRLQAWRKIKKADQPGSGRSACDGGDCYGQAAARL